MAAGIWLVVPAAGASEGPPIVVGTTSGLDPDKIVVEDQALEAEYHYALDLPEGTSLHPSGSQEKAGEIAGEVVLEDSAGKFLGAYDQPLALGSDNKLLPSTYRIEGETLIQTVDFSDAAFPVVIDSIYTSATPPGSMGIMAFVGVPSNYVYNTNLGPRHDYCTKAPDEFPSLVGANANFRGPCARHDMCYDNSSISKFTCDQRLLADMDDNCYHFYSRFDPNRAACIATAEIYFAVVVVAT